MTVTRAPRALPAVLAAWEPGDAGEWAEVNAMDLWLDNLETLWTAIAQRRMTLDQLDRTARLLQRAEISLIARPRRKLLRERGRS